MTIAAMPDLSLLRDAAGVAIARALVAGRPVSDAMLRDFAEIDDEVSSAPTWYDHDDHGMHPGAAFGL